MAERPSRVLILSLAMLGVGCSGGVFPSPIATDPAPPASAGPRADFLPIAKLRWARGAETAVELAPDGTLTDHGTVLGTVRADGTFETGDRKRTLVMQPDGSIHVTTGFDARIAEDGTATLRVHGEPDDIVTLEKVSRPRGGKPGLTAEGLSPKTARTAMWILMIPDFLRVLSSDGE